MGNDELARALRRATEKGALKLEKMVHIILFGIKYADELNEYPGKAIEVVRSSGVLPVASAVEVRHGMRLAKYVLLDGVGCDWQRRCLHANQQGRNGGD